ncbi:MAG: Bax inhibitor-1/YccA family protein [bacterium]
MRTSNPALNDNVFLTATSANPMTLAGTVVKTYILLAFLSLGFLFTWNSSTEGYKEAFAQSQANPQFKEDGTPISPQIAIPNKVFPYVLLGSLGGFAVALIVIFNPPSAPYLSPVYAVLEGFALGAISAGFEAKYPGITLQAIAATFGTLFGLLIAYTAGLRASDNFKLGVIAATFGICLVYLLDLILSFFGLYVPVVNDNSVLGIAFSVFVVIVAAMNLVLDFDFIENGIANKCPKYMEWYGAFGLLVTLVWLYIEFIKLLAKLRSRD